MADLYRILYPENRLVSADWIRSQGHDAAIDSAAQEHGPFSDDDVYAAFVETVPAPDIEESIQILEDMGRVTFASSDGGGR